MYYLGIDPGRDKCGVAVLDKEGNVHEHFVVQTALLDKQILSVKNSYKFSDIIIGDGTGADNIIYILRQSIPGIAVHKIDEYMTTLQARKRYWDIYPPKGLWKLVPLSLRVPPIPYDDVVAIILVEQYLENTKP